MPQLPTTYRDVFATATYSPGPDGELHVVLPSRCPFASPLDDNCRLHVDHRRERKTGPGFPVAVLACATHAERRFTAYPPGHFPYGREPLLAASPNGPLLLDGPTGELSWQNTLFQAAIDAGVGVRWHTGSPADDLLRRRTQGRRLERIERLLGVHQSLNDRDREEIAARLQVPTMVIRDAAMRWQDCWTGRGRAVETVLTAPQIDATFLDRLLSAGYVSAAWPRPARWCPRRRVWLRARPLPPPPKGARDPPTNSRGETRGALGAASEA